MESPSLILVPSLLDFLYHSTILLVLLHRVLSLCSVKTKAHFRRIRATCSVNYLLSNFNLSASLQTPLESSTEVGVSGFSMADLPKTTATK